MTPKVSPINKDSLTPKTLLEMAAESVDDIEAILLVVMNKNGDAKTTWNAITLPMILTLLKIGELDINRTIEKRVQENPDE